MNGEGMCRVDTCMNASTGLVCDTCWLKFNKSLEWLYEHVGDLEYRMNKAYGREPGEHVSGGAAHPPLPLRDAIHQLLYESDGYGNDGLRVTLRTYLRCLNVPYVESDTPRLLLRRLSRQSPKRLREHEATPAYIPQFLLIERKAKRLLAPTLGPSISYGECPTPGCAHGLDGGPDDEEIRCRYCGQTYPVGLLKARQHWRLANDFQTGTQTMLLKRLESCGVSIKPGTLRKWVAEGSVRPVGSSGGRKLYRTRDVYERATRNLIPVDDAWDGKPPETTADDTGNDEKTTGNTPETGGNG